MSQSQPHRSRLIVLSAPSGAGKTTLCQRLLADFPQLRLSISCTTRAPRGAETNGREYFFLTREEFQRQVSDGRFAEWAEVHGNLYGTSKDFIGKAFADGRSLLLDIDVQGARSLAQAYPAECFRVFISPPSMVELEARLLSRGTDDARAIQKRLANARTEMKAAAEFDKIIVNDDLDRSYSELKGLVASALRVEGAPA